MAPKVNAIPSNNPFWPVNPVNFGQNGNRSRTGEVSRTYNPYVQDQGLYARLEEIGRREFRPKTNAERLDFDA